MKWDGKVDLVTWKKALLLLLLTLRSFKKFLEYKRNSLLLHSKTCKKMTVFVDAVAALLSSLMRRKCVHCMKYCVLKREKVLCGLCLCGFVYVWLIVFSIPVTGFRCYEKVIEKVVQVFKSWPLFGISIPALKHDTVNRIRTFNVWRFRHSIPTFNLFNHFPIVHPCISCICVFSHDCMFVMCVCLIWYVKKKRRMRMMMRREKNPHTQSFEWLQWNQIRWKAKKKHETTRRERVTLTGAVLLLLCVRMLCVSEMNRFPCKRDKWKPSENWNARKREERDYG